MCLKIAIAVISSTNCVKAQFSDTFSKWKQYDMWLLKLVFERSLDDCKLTTIGSKKVTLSRMAVLTNFHLSLIGYCGCTAFLHQLPTRVSKLWSFLQHCRVYAWNELHSEKLKKMFPWRVALPIVGLTFLTLAVTFFTYRKIFCAPPLNSTHFKKERDLIRLMFDAQLYSPLWFW